MGLIHGAQPDALVLCHAEGRDHMRGIPSRKLPSLEDTLNYNIQAAKLTNPNAKFVGISINTSSLSDSESGHICEKYQNQFSLPCVDPIRHGVASIIDQL